ncbi:hypothetical protein Taro_035559 [Colocasia esculenta]|uniref:Uncharacterized protein n=1 Tax=Colocasia esculenta TaxID=4460 RepID=A0A843W456_COLES|nr:hypothetical protein [Colocasia esculenta]
MSNAIENIGCAVNPAWISGLSTLNGRTGEGRCCHAAAAAPQPLPPLAAEAAASLPHSPPLSSHPLHFSSYKYPMKGEEEEHPKCIPMACMCACKCV